MPRQARLLPVFLSAIVLLMALCVGLGVLLLPASVDLWQSGELLLTRSRVVPRHISLQSDTVEFILRVAFSAAFAISCLSFAAIVGLVAGHRIVKHRQVALTGVYDWPRAAVRACWIPLAFFLVWLGLVVALPLVFP